MLIKIFILIIKDFISSLKNQITYLKPEALFVVKTSGQMSGQGFIDMAKAILNHPQHRTDGNILFDHSELILDHATLQDLEQIRHFHREHEKEIGHGRSAMVVNSIVQWYDLWAQGRKIDTANKVGVFDDFDKAMDWLKE